MFICLNKWRTCLFAFFLCALALSGVQCTRSQKAPANPVVSSQPVPIGKSFAPVAQLPRVEVSYGEGDCAPRLANGMRGTCINGKACNGFGFRGPNGQIQCACFDTVGGCGANEGCSLVHRRCEPVYRLDRAYPPKGR